MVSEQGLHATLGRAPLWRVRTGHAGLALLLAAVLIATVSKGRSPYPGTPACPTGSLAAENGSSHGRAGAEP